MGSINAENEDAVFSHSIFFSLASSGKHRQEPSNTEQEVGEKASC
jgi:hypothetical protein